MELPTRHPYTHYSKKARRYGFALKYLFNTRVDHTTLNRWADLIALGRSIDTYIDEGERKSLYERTSNIQTYLDSPQIISSQFPSLASEALGQETFETLNSLGKAILDVNIEYKNTTSLKKYIYLRRLEGILYARLIYSVATPQVTSERGYKWFTRFLEPIGEISNLANSFHDIFKDHAKGEIALEPTHTTRIQLAGHMALVACRTLHGIRQDLS